MIYLLLLRMVDFNKLCSENCSVSEMDYRPEGAYWVAGLPSSETHTCVLPELEGRKYQV